MGKEVVAEVPEKIIPKTQENETQSIVAFRDDCDDTMSGVEMGVEGCGREISEFSISQELDRDHRSAALRLASILTLPQMVFTPRKNHDTSLIDYCIFIIMNIYEIK